MNTIVTKALAAIIASVVIAMLLASVNLFARVSTLEFKERTMEENIVDIKHDTSSILCRMGEKSKCGK